MATTSALDHLDLGGRIDWLSQLDTAYKPPRNFRRTSIICTIGPKTNSVEAINKLREAGLNVVRMNFSHGSYEYHRTCFALQLKSQKLPARAVPCSCKGTMALLQLLQSKTTTTYPMLKPHRVRHR